MPGGPNMKKFFTLLTLTMSLNSFAAGYELNCTASHNMDKVIETKVSIQDGERNKNFGEYDQFRFFVTASDKNMIEVQSMDLNGPSRSYATSNLSEKGAFVELSVWTRDYLLEVRCSRL